MSTGGQGSLRVRVWGGAGSLAFAHGRPPRRARLAPRRCTLSHDTCLAHVCSHAPARCNTENTDALMQLNPACAATPNIHTRSNTERGDRAPATCPSGLRPWHRRSTDTDANTSPRVCEHTSNALFNVRHTRMMHPKSACAVCDCLRATPQRAHAASRIEAARLRVRLGVGSPPRSAGWPLP